MAARLASRTAALSIVAALTTITAPPAGASAAGFWSAPLRIDPALGPDGPLALAGVRCPTDQLCVGSDIDGRVITTTDPVGAASAWSITATSVDPGGAPFAISCPTSDFCAAADVRGNVVTSTNPTGGVAAWAITPKIFSNFGGDISCPTISLCVIVDYAGNVVVSTDPTGGAGTWTTTHVGLTRNTSFSGVSCPSVHLCVAGSNTGQLATSSDPTGGTRTWKSIHTDPIAGISCPTTRFCAATVSAEGNVLTSTDPTGSARTWKAANLLRKVVSGGPLATISCATVRQCVAIDNTGDVFSSIDPAAGASAWTTTNITGGVALTSTPTVYDNAVPDDISCPTTSLCVTADTTASIQSSTDPGGQAEQAAEPHLHGRALAAKTGSAARLAFALSAGIPPGKPIKRITGEPTGGVRFARSARSLIRGIVLKGSDRKRLNFTATVSRGVLTISLKHATSKIEVVIAAPAISVSRKLAAQVKRRAVMSLTFALQATDAGNATTRLALRVKPS